MRFENYGMIAAGQYPIGSMNIWRIGHGMGWHGMDAKMVFYLSTLVIHALLETMRVVRLAPERTLPLARLGCTNYRSEAEWQ
jgi:hypothetical protein